MMWKADDIGTTLVGRSGHIVNQEPNELETHQNISLGH